MKEKKKRIHQMTVAQLEARFSTDDACKAYLQEQRWPEGVCCARCGSIKVWKLAKEWHWQCKDCAPDGYRFSVLVGSIFENTNIPLSQWFKVIHLMLVSKKGISALQIYRMMGFGSYKTAWYMCHRVRAGLQEKTFRKLIGIVEVDETFVGGKSVNRHKDRNDDDTKGDGPRKAVIAGAVARKGNVVARVIGNTGLETLTKFVRHAVSHRVSLLCTDHWSGYNRLGREYPHATTNHAAGEYVVGAVHTNTIEGFWSMIKRGIVGTFHKVSSKYLPLYVAEFEFRYNNRNNENIFGDAIAQC